MDNTIISPSILAADFANLKDEIISVKNAGAQWIHIDVMDGHFVPNITMGPCVVKDIRKITNLTLDVHLMIENPEKYIGAFIKAGSDIITIHYEACKNNCIEIIEKLKANNIKAGISIKPKTKVSEIEFLLDKVDLVLVMTVEPGFSGQTFIDDCAEKIKQIKEISPQTLIIEVDGGINKETAKICKKYGANALVVGNYVYKAEDRKSAIESLRQ